MEPRLSSFDVIRSNQKEVNAMGAKKKVKKAVKKAVKKVKKAAKKR